MTKSDLIEKVSRLSNKPPLVASDTVELLFQCMKDALKKDDRIELRGFGSFENRVYGAYEARNPKTGKAVTVAAKRVPFFKTAKDLRDSINKPQSSSG